MEWWIVLSVGLAILFALMLTGLPVFVAFLVLNLGGVLVLFGPRGFGLFANSIYDTVTSPGFVTVPLFILMGEILFRSGTVEVLSRSMDTLVGFVRGRLYHLVVALSTVFGALSGSAVAVAAMLGRSAMPRMEALGYDRRLSASTILGGASLAPIIPPSVLVIVVGSLVTDVSIAGLLIAGIVPGLLLAAALVGYVAWRVARDPSIAPAAEAPPEDAPPFRRLRALLAMAPFALIVFFVMGLILLGVATPSEAAATGVAGAILTAAIYRRLTLGMLGQAALSAATTSAVILVIVASSKLFSQLLAFTGATTGLIEALGALSLSDALMLLCLMAIPFVLCMFIDQFAFLLLAIPLYEPILDLYGYDPIWFWTLFLINLTVGSLTPPFGYTLFALKSAVPGMPIGELYRSAWPVVGIFVAGLFVLAALPGLVTWLPARFG